MSIEQTARKFFEACDTGGGWAACKTYCHEGASFACQADILKDVSTLADYTDWIRDSFGPLPDGRFELSAFATDEGRRTVVAAGVWRATNIGEGNQGAPTGRSGETDYAYVMTFDGNRIRHMTKIWNDVPWLRQFGWG